MKILRILFGVIFVIFAVGCQSVTESDRQLIDQSLKASIRSLDLDVAREVSVQAIMDVKKNLDVLQANLGSPKTPVPYSPSASEEARTKAAAQHQNPWWKVILTSLVGVLLGGGAAQGLVRLVPSMFGGPAANALEAVVEGIARLRQDQGSSSASVPMGALLGKLAEVQEKHGVREIVRSYAKRVENRLAADGSDTTPPPFGQQAPPSSRP